MYFPLRFSLHYRRPIASLVIFNWLWMLLLPAMSSAVEFAPKSVPQKRVIKIDQNKRKAPEIISEPKVTTDKSLPQIKTEYPSYLEIGGLYNWRGKKHFSYGGEIWLPILQQQNQLLFIDLNFFDYSGKEKEGSLICGYRTLNPQTDKMWGIYFGYSTAYDFSGKRQQQWNFGGEWWLKNWFFGNNFYLPKIKEYFVKEERFGLSRAKYFNTTLRGADLTLGYEFNNQCALFFSGYYFHRARSVRLPGARILFKYSCFPKWGLLNKIGMEAGISYDRERKTAGFIGIKLNFGLKNIQTVLSKAERHLINTVLRSQEIKTYQSVHRDQFSTFGSDGVHKQEDFSKQILQLSDGELNIHRPPENQDRLIIINNTKSTKATSGEQNIYEKALLLGNRNSQIDDRKPCFATISGDQTVSSKERNERLTLENPVSLNYALNPVYCQELWQNYRVIPIDQNTGKALCPEPPKLPFLSNARKIRRNNNKKTGKFSIFAEAAAIPAKISEDVGFYLPRDDQIISNCPQIPSFREEFPVIYPKNRAMWYRIINHLPFAPHYYELSNGYLRLSYSQYRAFKRVEHHLGYTLVPYLKELNIVSPQYALDLLNWLSRNSVVEGYLKINHNSTTEGIYDVNEAVLNLWNVLIADVTLPRDYKRYLRKLSYLEKSFDVSLWYEFINVKLPEIKIDLKNKSNQFSAILHFLERSVLPYYQKITAFGVDLKFAFNDQLYHCLLNLPLKQTLICLEENFGASAEPEKKALMELIEELGNHNKHWGLNDDAWKIYAADLQQFIEKVSSSYKNLPDCNATADWFNKKKGEFKAQGKAISINDLSDITAVLGSTINEYYGYYPRISQLITLYTLLNYGKIIQPNAQQYRGIIGELATGEGKSVVIYLTAMLEIIRGKNVDILTSSPELAIRDAQNFAPLYKKFGVTVATNSVTEKNNYRKIYDSDVIYGTAVDFIADSLREKNLGRFADVTIVDEADSLFFDSNQVMVLLSSAIPGTEVINQILLHLYSKARDIMPTITDRNGNKPGCYLQLSRRDIAQEIKDRLQQRFPQALDYFKFIAASEPLEEPLIKIPSRLKHYVYKMRDTWIDSLLKVPYFIEGRDYILDRTENNRTFGNETVRDLKSKLMIVDYANTGTVMANTVWENGIQQYLEIAHELALSPTNLVTVFSSYSTFLATRQEIIGVTGTLGEKHHYQYLSDNYQVMSAIFPSFATKRLLDYGVKIFHSDLGRWQKIVEEIIAEAVTGGRVVLVILDTILEVENLAAEIKNLSDIRRLITYTKGNLEDQTWLKEPLDVGTVVIATNLGGRGTDLKLTKKVLKHGGLHVIKGSLSATVRVDEQAKGRAARSGEPGSCSLIESVTHLPMPFHCDLSAETEPRLSEKATACILAERNRREEERLTYDSRITVPKNRVNDEIYSRYAAIVRRTTSLLNWRIEIWGGAELPPPVDEKGDVVRLQIFNHEPHLLFYQQRQLKATIKVTKLFEILQLHFLSERMQLQKGAIQLATIGEDNYRAIELAILLIAPTIKGIIYKKEQRNLTDELNKAYFQKIIAWYETTDQKTLEQWQQNSHIDLETKYLRQLIVHDTAFSDLKGGEEKTDGVFLAAKLRLLSLVFQELCNKKIDNGAIEQLRESFGLLYGEFVIWINEFQSTNVTRYQQLADLFFKRGFQDELSRTLEGTFVRNPSYLMREVTAAMAISEKSRSLNNWVSVYPLTHLWQEVKIRVDYDYTLNAYQIYQYEWIDGWKTDRRYRRNLHELLEIIERAVTLNDDENLCWMLYHLKATLQLVLDSADFHDEGDREDKVIPALRAYANLNLSALKNIGEIIRQKQITLQYLMRGVTSFGSELANSYVLQVEVLEQVAAILRENAVLLDEAFRNPRGAVVVGDQVMTEALIAKIDATAMFSRWLNKTMTGSPASLNATEMHQQTELPFSVDDVVKAVYDLEQQGGKLFRIKKIELAPIKKKWWQRWKWFGVVVSSIVGVLLIVAGGAILALTQSVFMQLLASTMISRGISDLISAAIHVIKKIPLEIGAYFKSLATSMAIKFVEIGGMLMVMKILEHFQDIAWAKKAHDWLQKRVDNKLADIKHYTSAEHGVEVGKVVTDRVINSVKQTAIGVAVNGAASVAVNWAFNNYPQSRDEVIADYRRTLIEHSRLLQARLRAQNRIENFYQYFQRELIAKAIPTPGTTDVVLDTITGDIANLIDYGDVKEDEIPIPFAGIAINCGKQAILSNKIKTFYHKFAGIANEIIEQQLQHTPTLVHIFGSKFHDYLRQNWRNRELAGDGSKYLSKMPLNDGLNEMRERLELYLKLNSFEENSADFDCSNLRSTRIIRGKKFTMSAAKLEELAENEGKRKGFYAEFLDERYSAYVKSGILENICNEVLKVAYEDAQDEIVGTIFTEIGKAIEEGNIALLKEYRTELVGMGISYGIDWATKKISAKNENKKEQEIGSKQGATKKEQNNHGQNTKKGELNQQNQNDRKMYDETTKTSDSTKSVKKDNLESLQKESNTDNKILKKRHKLHCSDQKHCYVVKKGDTLIGIARRFKISYIDLLAANEGLVDPNLIYASDEINLPHAAVSVESEILNGADKFACENTAPKTANHFGLNQQPTDQAGQAALGRATKQEVISDEMIKWCTKQGALPNCARLAIEAAELSYEKVYRDKNGKLGVENFKKKKYSALRDAGYTLVDYYDDKQYENNGYFGIALARVDDHGKKHIIIASRGTELLSIKDLSSYVSLVVGKIPSQIESLQSFVTRVRKWHGNAKQIMLTGHSQGAALSLLNYAQNSQQKDLVVVAFESPGVKATAKRMNVDVKQLDQSRMMILNADFNLVNQVGEQLGKPIIIDNGKQGDCLRSHRIALLRRAVTADGYVKVLKNGRRLKLFTDNKWDPKADEYFVSRVVIYLFYTTTLGGSKEDEND